MSESTTTFILMLIVLMVVFFGPTNEKSTHLSDITKLILAVCIGVWFVAKAYIELAGMGYVGS